jgi:hypothetical protein
LYPQCGFSLASRRISSRSERSSAGRPGIRCEYVHRRAMSWRCQRSSVPGLNEKAAQAARGSERLSAASSARSAPVAASTALLLHRKLLSGAGARALHRRWPTSHDATTIARSLGARSVARVLTELVFPPDFPRLSGGAFAKPSDGLEPSTPSLPMPEVGDTLSKKTTRRHSFSPGCSKICSISGQTGRNATDRRRESPDVRGFCRAL